jgi:hypothetical protein
MEHTGTSTNCVTDLNWRNKMKIFKVTFEVSIIFEAAGAAVKIGPSLKLNYHNHS